MDSKVFVYVDYSAKSVNTHCHTALTVNDFSFCTWISISYTTTQSDIPKWQWTLEACGSQTLPYS